MKRIKVLVLFLLGFMCCPLSNHSSAKHIRKTQLDNIITKVKTRSHKYGARWHRLIKAISMTESNGDTMAVSRCGRYVGYLQISKILVRDCNAIVGYKKYNYNDRYDKQKSVEMFLLYQEHYNPGRNVEYAIRLWNSGDLDCMHNKKATNGYYRRVMKNYYSLGECA